MTATDELRRLLDERGVAHSDHYFSTTWRDGHGILHLAGEPMADGSLVVDMLTPDQAIAATLGNSRVKPPCDGCYCPLCGAIERTCHIEWRDDSHDTDAGYESDGSYFCTACGADLPYLFQECWDDYQAGNYEKPFNYCPSCGCKVVGE